MSFTALTSSPVWTAAGWTMLHLVWVGAAVGVLAVLSRRLFRSVGPLVRHTAALVWLVVLAVSPAVVFVRVFESTSRDVQELKLAVTRSEAVNGDGSAIREGKIPARPESVGHAEPRAIEAVRWRLESVVPYLPAFWLVGSLSALVMLTTGLIGVHRLRRSSRIIENGEIASRLRVLADSLGIARRVSIAVCDRLAVPVLVGVIRPLILLPPAALCGWSMEQLEMVLLHELAHLRRLDNLINILQRVVESLLFFHPVVWWLSGWLRLERELCCDRLVVGRLGQPVAYAEMLVALTGSSHRGRAAVVAMADRQVLIRIRRLLNIEDRSMKLTMPEGFGLLGALIVGTSLVFGLQAAQPEPKGESDESVRQALGKAAQAVLAIPRGGLEYDFRVDTLGNIAQAQMKLGDRATALATLKVAYESIERVDIKKNDDVEILGTLLQVAKYQRELGDLVAARKTLDRMVKLVDSLESRPFVELVQVAGSKEPQRKKHEANESIRCELLLMIADEQLVLGDRDLALATCQRALKAVQPQQGMLKPMILSYVAIYLQKAGDMSGARAVIEQARRLGSELPEHPEKEGALAHIARAMAETGDFDGALQLTLTLRRDGSQSAIQRIVDSFTEYEPGEAWLHNGGIKITIGAPMLKVKDREAARIALPKLARAARSVGDPLIQARTLSMLAHLQARTGDFVGAIRTTESIPIIKRKDFPGPSDGFYDAIKPGTLAIIAQLQFEAGEKAGASERLREAVTLSRAIEAADQKLVSQILIIRKQVECDELDPATAFLREAIAFAQRQPEPLRSRGLAMLSRSQVKTGDVAGAQGTIRTIREYPGLERVSASYGVAEWYEGKGDQEGATLVYRDALRCVQSKATADAQGLMGKAKKLGAVTAATFVDFEYELEPEMVTHERQWLAMFLYANLGDIEQAAKIAQAMPPGTRRIAVGNLAGNFARKGQVAEAMKLAERLETAEERLTAYDLVAIAIRDGRTKK
jgi:beta-lactamase regulating signal transducer with metallopeptidase domain/tetratricopeptide (TPR) repeat protein